MYNKLFVLAVIGCAIIAFLSDEASAKKHKYRKPSDSFDTRRISGKDTYMIIDDSKPTNVIVVELHLGNLGNNELLMITDNPPIVNTKEPQKFTYSMMGNQLKVLDQSYGVRTEEYERVQSDVVTFESFTGRVFIMYMGKNAGGATVKYQVYPKRQQCAKGDLTVTSGDIDCEDDLAGYATKCTGNFPCPENYISTSTATCLVNEWIGTCLPNQAAYEDLGSAYEACRGDLETCLDPGIVKDLMNNDDIDVEDDTAVGRSSGGVLKRLRAMCAKYCQQPRKDCFNAYFPKDFSNLVDVRRYKNCSRCVYVHKCTFSGTYSI